MCWISIIDRWRIVTTERRWPCCYWPIFFSKLRHHNRPGLIDDMKWHVGQCRFILKKKKKKRKQHLALIFLLFFAPFDPPFGLLTYLIAIRTLHLVTRLPASSLFPFILSFFFLPLVVSSKHNSNRLCSFFFFSLTEYSIDNVGERSRTRAAGRAMQPVLQGDVEFRDRGLRRLGWGEEGEHRSLDHYRAHKSQREQHQDHRMETKTQVADRHRSMGG